MSDSKQTTPSEYPAHPAPVAPHLVVNGAARAVDFYRRAFGATELFRQPADDGERLLHVSLDIRGGLVMLCDDFPEYYGGASRAPTPDSAPPVTIHINVPDIDATMAQAREAGAEITMPAQDMFWGDRYGKLRDPFGHEWSLSTPIARKQ